MVCLLLVCLVYSIPLYSPSRPDSWSSLSGHIRLCGALVWAAAGGALKAMLKPAGMEESKVHQIFRVYEIMLGGFVPGMVEYGGVGLHAAAHGGIAFLGGIGHGLVDHGGGGSRSGSNTSNTNNTSSNGGTLYTFLLSSPTRLESWSCSSGSIRLRGALVWARRSASSALVGGNAAVEDVGYTSGCGGC